MKLGRIVKEYRDMHRLSQQQIADRSGLSKAYISRLEDGINPRTGKPVSPTVDTLRALAPALKMTFEQIVAALGDEQLITVNHSAKRTSVSVPVYDGVAAGIPLEAIENIVDYEELSMEEATLGEHYGLVVKGSSMSPRISDGDVVIVRKQDTCQNGDVAIVLVNGNEATCKRVHVSEAGISLLPLNPSYTPMFYSADEVARLPVRIIGKVVELRAKF